MGETLVDRYSGCNADQDESGAEIYYQVEFAERTTIRAMVFDRDPVDIDVHVLTQVADGATCLQRDHTQIQREFEPGVYYFSLDTFVAASGMPLQGEYVFVVMKAP